MKKILILRRWSAVFQLPFATFACIVSKPA